MSPILSCFRSRLREETLPAEVEFVGCLFGWMLRNATMANGKYSIWDPLYFCDPAPLVVILFGCLGSEFVRNQTKGACFYLTIHK